MQPDQQSLAVRDLYLHTVKMSVAGVLLQTPGVKPAQGAAENLTDIPYDESRRVMGADWPRFGLTMVGTARLDNIEALLLDVIKNNVEGDFVECGVWRGGSSLFAKALLTAHGAADRQVHLVDSFQGLPAPTTKGDAVFWSKMKFLEVPKEVVMASFERYNLLDDSVHFWKGYFRYSMPLLRANHLGKRRIAVLRADGDMFESTMDILFNAYDMLSVGGYLIIDDWRIKVCQAAVLKFFKLHGIEVKVVNIPNQRTASYIQKKDHFELDLDWYKKYNATRSEELKKEI
jgi:hypothetical protein